MKQLIKLPTRDFTFLHSDKKCYNLKDKFASYGTWIFKKVNSNHKYCFDNVLLIETQVLHFQHLYSVNDSNVEAVSIHFESDLVSETRQYHFFHCYGLAFCLSRVLSHISFFLLTHTFRKLTCIMFISWFTMVIFLF